MGARKIEEYPVQILDLDAIEVDHKIQSRVSTSMEYQREFSEAMLRGAEFPPVTVFFDGKKYWLADGFHRFGARKILAKADRRFRGIKAEVRGGTRRDAMVFSAGANQEFSIPRKPEDIRKAVWMLLDDEECFVWSGRRIADHVGANPITVRKYRTDYCVKRGIPLPDEIVDSKGEVRTKEGKKKKVDMFIRYQRGKPYWCTSIRGKTIYLAKDEGKAREKLAKIKDDAGKEQGSKALPRIVLNSNHRMRIFFSKHGISFESLCFNFILAGTPGLQSGISGLHGHSVTCVCCDFERPGALLLSLGNLLLLRLHSDPSSRAVVVCYPLDGPPVLLDLARQLGVEFLTPEELVASLKGVPATSEDPNSRDQGVPLT